MQFTLSHHRQPLGQQISVKIAAGANQQITQVTTQFDGFTIGSDTLAPGSTQYERVFDGQDAEAGDTHTLVVTALDQNGNPESSTAIWTDAS